MKRRSCREIPRAGAFARADRVVVIAFVVAGIGLLFDLLSWTYLLQVWIRKKPTSGTWVVGTLAYGLALVALGVAFLLGGQPPTGRSIGALALGILVLAAINLVATCLHGWLLGRLEGTA